MRIALGGGACIGELMGFRIEDYEALRPYVYHTCPRGNADRILNLRRMEPTAVLLELAERADLLRTRRGEDLELRIAGTPVLIRDQMPLNPANIDFEAGWELADLVEYVNRRIFFWPGGPAGPIDYGSNHFNRYAEEQPVVLRLRLRSLLAANPGRQPQFSKYNSGAARQNQGKRIPRGPKTFIDAGRFPGTPGDVREVAFASPVVLPSDTERAFGLTGPWRRTFEQAAV
jgi:hypothetical protein